MELYDKFDELRAHSGVGTCLYVKNENGKYSIFMPLETAPSVMATPESIDIDVTSSDAITKVEGKMTLEEKEVDFLLHRDSLRRLKEYSSKGICDFLVVNHDYTAVKFSATISYIQQDATSGDPLKGTVKFTPTKSDGFIDNCYDLLQKTAKFINGINPIIEVSGSSATFNVETSPESATVTVTSEDSDIATVNYESGVVTVTKVKEGSAIIKLVASNENYASWTTTVLAICK